MAGFRTFFEVGSRADPVRSVFVLSYSCCIWTNGKFNRIGEAWHGLGASKRPRSLEFESPNHVIGDTLAGQAMFGLPHTQNHTQRCHIRRICETPDGRTSVACDNHPVSRNAIYVIASCVVWTKARGLFDSKFTKIDGFSKCPYPFFHWRDAHAITLGQAPGASNTVEFIAAVRKVLIGGVVLNRHCGAPLIGLTFTAHLAHPSTQTSRNNS